MEQSEVLDLPWDRPEVVRQVITKIPGLPGENLPKYSGNNCFNNEQG